MTIRQWLQAAAVVLPLLAVRPPLILGVPFPLLWGLWVALVDFLPMPADECSVGKGGSGDKQVCTHRRAG